MHRDELALRQQRLLARSARLRTVLTDQLQVYKKPLAVVDRVRGGLKWLHDHPQWTLGAVLVLIIARPKRTMVWGGRVWWAWRTFKQTKRWLAKQASQE